MCCCRSTSRACCWPRRVSASPAMWRSRSRTSRATVRAHSKLGFSQILSELGLPQPETRVVANASELTQAKRFPMVLKTPVGTASRGTWIVKDGAELETARRGHRGRRRLCRFTDRAGRRAWRPPAVPGGVRRRSPDCVARLPTDRTRRRGRHSIKESVDHPVVRGHLGAHRRAPALARRLVGRLYRRPGWDAVLLRLQSAAGRADERGVGGARSGGCAGAGVARRDDRRRTGEHEWCPHPSCCAGAARLRGAGQKPVRHPARVLAAARQARALCRKQGGTDAGDDRLDELRAADGHRALAAGDAVGRAHPSARRDGARSC